jgi:hypothetical protein
LSNARQTKRVFKPLDLRRLRAADERDGVSGDARVPTGESENAPVDMPEEQPLDGEDDEAASERARKVSCRPESPTHVEREPEKTSSQLTRRP